MDSERQFDLIAKGWAGAGAICAAVLGYALAPSLRFASPTDLVGIGVLLSGGLAGLWLAAHNLDRKKSVNKQIAWPLALTIIGIADLAYTGMKANYVSAAQEVRCLKIQNDMLSLHPSRDDLPALFEALACQPQGYADVQLPNATRPAALKLPPQR